MKLGTARSPMAPDTMIVGKEKGAKSCDTEIDQGTGKGEGLEATLATATEQNHVAMMVTGCEGGVVGQGREIETGIGIGIIEISIPKGLESTETRGIETDHAAQSENRKVDHSGLTRSVLF